MWSQCLHHPHWRTLQWQRHENYICLMCISWLFPSVRHLPMRPGRLLRWLLHDRNLPRNFFWLLLKHTYRSIRSRCSEHALQHSIKRLYPQINLRLVWMRIEYHGNHRHHYWCSYWSGNHRWASILLRGEEEKIN